MCIVCERSSKEHSNWTPLTFTLNHQLIYKDLIDITLADEDAETFFMIMLTVMLLLMLMTLTMLLKTFLICYSFGRMSILGPIVISLSGQFTINGLINVLSNSPSLEEQVLSYLQGVTNIYIHHMQLLVDIEGWVVIEY